MKFKSLTIATLALFAGAAHAQSSVTLYGLIDAGVAYTNSVKTPTGGASEFQMASGLVSTSRWGLRGSEDLGGGLHAVFQLENGFMVNNGTFKNGGDEFGRQAWVGLSSDKFGTLTMGRQYDFTVDYVQALSATGSGWGGNLAAHPFDNDNMDNDQRLNNSVKFSSATYAGFQVGAMYAFSNDAGQFSNNNAYAFGARYANGPITAAASYLQINRSPTAQNLTGAASTGDSDWLAYGGEQQIWTAAAQYKFANNASVGVVYSHSVTYDIGNNGSPSLLGNSAPLVGGSMKFDNFEINGRYFVRPDFSLGAAYTYTMGAFSGGPGYAAADPHWNQVTVQADYLLSRSTDIYLMGVYQHVAGGNGNQAFNAGVYNMTQSSGNTQVVAAVGMRHRF
ncbi:MAG TPA: porin [Trinickia sp.]|jgi:GBP family porin|uniref:porin n=1 Tax=Trinickia sp. TaxID=2571163 RepID=UPI002C1031CB|nr:porin [Trinickia sp.]HTI16871.1 porin [Trinickia sp.]